MYFTSSIALEQFNLVTCEVYYLQAMGVENYQFFFVLFFFKGNLSGCQRAGLEVTLLILKAGS